MSVWAGNIGNVQNDQLIKQILTQYHHNGITDRKKISRLLKMEHGVTMSAQSTHSLPVSTKQQLVLDQLAQDPLHHRGPRLVQEAIMADTGHLLMSGDGHDKLSKIGFPIWAIRDQWSGKWLGMWVVPNNRLKTSIAYLYLSLVYEIGGMPLQTTTDCGSETTEVYGFATALREFFSPNLSTDELSAHQFLKSVHNITIKWGWLCVRLQWGDNVKVFWEAGEEIYNDMDPRQYDLVQWLWLQLIQQELDKLKHRLNTHTVRFDRNKILPSGVSSNIAMALHKDYGAEDCLQLVDRDVVKNLMVEIGGEDLVRFVDVEYSAHAQLIFDNLGFKDLTFQNVWPIFSAMLPLM
ncbi:hypothetical protein BDR03DRAFT_985638 [Suillus americanus]|nr:hypothetical protein BDR03DRAFT_985638 [Suillus americanus]